MMSDEITEAELDLNRLRGALETWREYLAGPCDHSAALSGPDCPPGPYDGHRHWTNWYEDNRGAVVAINHLLAGEYDYASAMLEIGKSSPLWQAGKGRDDELADDEAES